MEETENSHFRLMQDQGGRWYQLLRSNSMKKNSKRGLTSHPISTALPSHPVALSDSSSPHQAWSWPLPTGQHPWPVPWRCLMPRGWGCPLPGPPALPCWGDPTDAQGAPSLNAPWHKFQRKKLKKKKNLIKHFPISNFPIRSTQMISLIFRYAQSTRNRPANSCIKDIKQVPPTFKSKK